jgi:proteasome lid subunit RPN8/RPN11
MLRLSADLVAKISAHGERTYPEECCGMLLGVTEGENRVVVATVEMNNSQDENRRRRFLVSPQQYREAERLAAEQRRELLGFYHSHPDHPAEPSAFDREHALPWFTYVIVSVRDAKAAAFTSWILSDARDRFNAQLLVITVDGPSASIPA